MENLDELIDVAPLGVARQSSLSRWSRPNGAQALVEDHKRDFAICTDLEDGPWWELDLGEPLPLRRIIIANRSDSRFRANASRLVVEVSQNHTSWITIHAGISYFGDGMVDPAMQLELDDRIVARHIRLSLPQRQHLHLRRVIVFVAKSAKLLAEVWKTHGFRPLPLDTPWIGKNGAYKIIEVGNQESDRIVGLKLRKAGRMGNNFIQLTNALFLAKRMGLAYVWAPPVKVGEVDHTVFDEATTLFDSATEPPAGLYLEGDFFYIDRIGANVMAPLSRAVQYGLAQRFLVPFIGMPPVPQEPDPERAKELAVHIRSGDIFSDRPHAGYVQPPLSYYTMIVDELLSRGLIDRVVIVAEDRLNPCIDALESHLSTRGIPVRLQSGSLFEDVTYLCGARHMVFGFGTFGLGVSLISGRIDTLHAFNDSRCVGLPNVREVTVLAARAGCYIARGEWKRTPEQIRLMLEFPQEDLERHTMTTQVDDEATE